MMKKGLGWLPDYPDVRDYTLEHDKVRGLVKATASNPERIDLRAHCSPVEDQGQLGACTAHAGVGLYEYFERRAFGKHLDASRRFLYKVTRNLAKVKGDTGAELRQTMGAMVLFGVPPEEYWPYDEKDFDHEPPAFLYAYASNFQALKYFRLDPPGTALPVLLNRVKKALAAGYALMFGFTVYDSVWRAANGWIPYPGPTEKADGGHAVMAVGYDDQVVIQGPRPNAPTTTGALLIRNSWGMSWGDGGYGWLPYRYVLEGLADDWWSMTKAEWIETGQFGE